VYSGPNLCGRCWQLIWVMHNDIVDFTKLMIKAPTRSTHPDAISNESLPSA